jgi:hypothetical protein
MRKTSVLLGVALCMPISTISVNAAGLAGVTLPETSTVGDKSLVLNGVGLVFTYVPAAGTTLAINGKDKLTIAGAPFGQLVFSVWLGPKPPTAGLKKGILGQ